MTTLLAMGKLKERFYLDASAEYVKRLGADFRLIELPEVRLPDAPSAAQIAAALSQEAALIRAKIPKSAWFCVFTPEGKLLSSEQLAQTVKNVRLNGKSNLCFLIGSSFGMDESLKAQADFRLSVSPMTFPHHLMRVMALEQIYRAESILAGTRYHK